MRLWPGLRDLLRRAGCLGWSGANNYRVVVIVRYRFKKVFVHKVLTHREYDDWNKLYRKGKV